VKENEVGGTCGTHGRREKIVHGFGGKARGKETPGRPREDGIRMDLREIGLGGWIGFDWLRIGTGGSLLWVRWWTFGLLRHGVSYNITVLDFGILLHCENSFHLLEKPISLCSPLKRSSSEWGRFRTSRYLYKSVLISSSTFSKIQNILFPIISLEHVFTTNMLMKRASLNEAK
jgi:hypothetical protein